jgi:hypothetical protein
MDVLSKKIYKTKLELNKLLTEKQKKIEKQQKQEELKLNNKLLKQLKKMSHTKKLEILDVVVKSCSHANLSSDYHFDHYKELAELIVEEFKNNKK